MKIDRQKLNKHSSLNSSSFSIFSCSSFSSSLSYLYFHFAIQALIDLWCLSEEASLWKIVAAIAIFAFISLRTKKIITRKRGMKKVMIMMERITRATVINANRVKMGESMNFANAEWDKYFYEALKRRMGCEAWEKFFLLTNFLFECYFLFDKRNLWGCTAQCVSRDYSINLFIVEKPYGYYWSKMYKFAFTCIIS